MWCGVDWSVVVWRGLLRDTGKMERREGMGGVE